MCDITQTVTKRKPKTPIRLNCNVSPDVHGMIEEMAKDDRRSMSETLRILIEEEFKRRRSIIR